MSDILRLALIQPTSTISINRNIALIEPMIRKAVSDDAQMISLPEVVNLTQKNREESVKEAQFETGDAFLARIQTLAKELDVWIHIGSNVVKLEDDARMANRAYMINNSGEILAHYDKIHMFDVDLEGGESYRESSSFRPGEEAVCVNTPWGLIGLTICYDVRFPQLHRTLAQAGAKLILNPAAFTRKTGSAHWHTLLTARAIENGCFIAAAAQTGDHEDGRETYGHSLIVAPWGNVLADAGTDQRIIIADLDFSLVEKAHEMVPSLKNGREFQLKVF